jgi:nucleoside-diphosphate-sugar epimerase
LQFFLIISAFENLKPQFEQSMKKIMTPEIGTKVLVTGVTSYIGIHVADQFLQAGCTVLGTNQRGERTDHITDYFLKYGPGKFKIQEIGYPTHDHVYDKVVQGTKMFVLKRINYNLY